MVFVQNDRPRPARIGQMCVGCRGGDQRSLETNFWKTSDTHPLNVDKGDAPGGHHLPLAI